MCQTDTGPRRSTNLKGGVRAAVVALAVVGTAWAQGRGGPHPDWRHIGNSAIEMALASPASGPVTRVWYSAEGARLYARTGYGRVFETADFEKWQASGAGQPAPQTDGAAASAPAGAVNARTSPINPLRMYAWGGQVLRSDDGGVTWADLTGYDRRSILGGAIRDLAVSPRDVDEVVAANDRGLWRSLDGGYSWAGLNDSLPNLPATRIAALPRASGGMRLVAGEAGVIEWPAGEKQAWRTVADTGTAELTAALSRTLGGNITAFFDGGDVLYAGGADGRLWTSMDKGRSWTPTAAEERGAVEGIWSDAREPRTALAALAARGAGPRVLRTVSGGQSWDDVSGELAEGSAWGVTADRASGAVYLATDRGLFTAHADLSGAGPVTSWTAVAGLPAGRVLDVKLDAAGNQLFAIVEGYGVYAALAPHRSGSLRLVNAADFSQRPAAPGSLLSVLGGRITAARAGDLPFPVLASSESESQIQVPFSVNGPSVALAVETGGGRQQFALPVENVSPAIFVDRDGTPLLLDGDSGVLLDAMNTAHSNSRVQILATGLGRVRPDWPAGVAGPADNPPRVVTPVRVYLDRTQLEVTRAVLAPGYVGLYLIEAQLPALVNAGPAELYVEQETQASNRVRIWVQP